MAMYNVEMNLRGTIKLQVEADNIDEAKEKLKCYEDLEKDLLGWYDHDEDEEIDKNLIF